MGIMSRKVLPVCGSMCFFCPSLRARSRQPVKRYKKLLTGIFPRSQDGEPNHRMISKLCEYASKNPMRIPKITTYLEQRCYKELRGAHIDRAKAVPSVYRKLLTSCKEQMPLFGTSLLSIVRMFLDQSQHEIQILGCNTLVDFLNSQTDSTYMFNVEGLVPKLCQLAQELGKDDKALYLRPAGLQALASMVHFMGQYSHIPINFDDIVSATLKNYDFLNVKEKNGKGQSFSQPDRHLEHQLPKCEGDDNGKTLTPYRAFNVGLDSPLEKNAFYWSRVCLQNMADLAKEATTLRHVLEPIFCYFDGRNQWSSHNGIAKYVLLDIQTLMEKSGENSHLLLSILVKHLEHKNVVKQPEMQVDIVKVTKVLAQHANLQTSIAIVTAMNDLMRHLRKCLQCSIEGPYSGLETTNWNSALYCALEDCLVELINKIGDIGPIYDMMAVVVENIPTADAEARAMMSTVYHTARMVSSVPNLMNQKKCFPEALFHQLLLAMTHPDHETRVGSHRVFSTILVPSMFFPWTIAPLSLSSNNSESAVLAVHPGLPSSSAIVKNAEHNSITSISFKIGAQHSQSEKTRAKGQLYNLDEKQNTDFTILEKEVEACLQLSSYQVGLLLSSIWIQATSLENIPANYEAIAHTFKLALIFCQAKASSHSDLVRCFQLSLSLRIFSLDQKSCLTPSCQRSLYTTAFSMLIFSAQAGGLVDLVANIKSNFTATMDDPHLRLIEDSRLQSVCTSDGVKVAYGSDEDTAGAVKFLSSIEADDMLLKELVTSHLLNKFIKSSEEELSIKKQLMEQFSPDENTYPHGAPLFMETPRSSSPLTQKEKQYSTQIMPCASFEDDELPSQLYGSQSDQRTSDSLNASDILNVNQLIESVLVTAREVASMPVSTASVPYDEMKSQCEAFGVGKQQKMSVLLNFKQQNEALQNGFSIQNEESLSDHENTINSSEACIKLTRNDDVISNEHNKTFRLPPSSPYDKFMRAAGC